MIGLSKLPSFSVNLGSEVLCKSCGGGVSSLEEMVQHWRKEKGGVHFGRPKIPSDKNGEMVKHWREERSEGKLVSQGQGRVPHAEVVFVNNKQEVEVGVARKEDVKVMNNKEVVMMNSKEVEVICSKGDVNVMNNREEAIKNNKEEVVMNNKEEVVIAREEVVNVNVMIDKEEEVIGRKEKDKDQERSNQLEDMECELKQEMEDKGQEETGFLESVELGVASDLKSENFENCEREPAKRAFTSEAVKNDLKKPNADGKGPTNAHVNKLLCDMCDYNCNTKGALHMHTLRKHRQMGHTEAVGDKFGPKNRKMAKLHRCSECDYSSEAKVNFLTHLSKTHRIETPNRSLMCDLCGYRTYVPAHLKNHTEAKHNGRIFNCNQCDFKTSYQMSLMHHKNIHDKDNWLQCDLCTYRCATSGNLKTHIDGKHNDTPSYPCPDCHSIFKTSSARSIHKVRIITTLIITTSSLPSSSSSSSSS